MGLYDGGECEECGNRLTFFSGMGGITWGHKEDCSRA